MTITASGATDSGGSGLAGYQYRTSTDGGSTWSAASAAPAAISGDGVTLVQMQAVDGAGNASAWTPASPGAGNTVKLDTTPPTAPTVGGGTGGWSAAASALVTASGSTDSPGSGVSGYQYETSTDGGTTWSAATPGASVSISAEGTTLVRFQALDVALHTSAWVQTSVQLDRTAPTRADGRRRLADLGERRLAHHHRLGRDRRRLRPRRLPVPHLDRRRQHVVGRRPAGASLNVPAEGETLVEYQSVDTVGNSSAWTSVGATGTVRLDRTAPTVPSATGGSSAWLNASTLPIAPTGATDAASGVASYQYRTSTNGGTTWSAATAGAVFNATAQGTTLVEFRAIDGVGLISPWSAVSPGGTAKLDQTAPSAPTITGGSNSYQNVASVTLTASGSTDTGGSGLSGYQYRYEFDDLTNANWSAAADGTQMTVSAEGLTIVQYRSVDNAGNVSAWVPTAAYPGDIVKIDRTPASVPTVSGGSLAWSAAASVTVTASGSSDGASAWVSDLAGYQYRTSTNGGSTWSAATAGASLAVSAQGTTLVQFRSLDNAGNPSAWTPASTQRDRHGHARPHRADRCRP